MPYLGSTLFVATLVGFLLLSLIASVLLAGALFGAATARAAELTARRPLRSIAVGLPVTVTATLLALGALQGGGAAKAVGAVVASATVASMLTGLAAVGLVVGSRMWARTDELQPYRRLLRGSVVVVVASVFPFFGWFVVFPLALSAGVGGLLRSLVARRPALGAVPAAEAYASR